MSLTLGLDLGPNSIGWALIDQSCKKVLATGVRVFPEGVKRKKGHEKSKNAERRTARAARRQIARRARRKIQLRELLTQNGLLPENEEELDHLLELNPYKLRKDGLDCKLTLHEFGRTLLHLTQRRGFLSNRKTDKSQENDVKGMKAEISDLAQKIENNNCRTLGEYLAILHSNHEPTSDNNDHKVRSRHTHRDMYRHEFDTLWEIQQKHHPQLLTENLKQQMSNIIFFQRKMYWPKSVVGRCDLEPKHRRCPRADRSAQRFRMLQEVNNLRVIDSGQRMERPLTDDERAIVLDYLSTAKDRKFDQIRKKLKLSDTVRFNLQAGQRDKLDGHKTDALLAAKKALGKDYLKMPEDQKDTLIAILIEEEREDEALRRLTEEAQLTEEQAQKAITVHLPDGYAKFSRLAIEKLLPHLEKGMLLMGDDETNSALHAAGYLRPDQRQIKKYSFLPSSPDLPNPIVRQALVEVRKVVNAIIREYGKPDSIHVELAREAKMSAEQRYQHIIKNEQNRQRRDEAAEFIRSFGYKPTRDTIQKYLLWKEQDEKCIYSGQPISPEQLLSSATDIDHILPRWRSLDNSMANKVVCFRQANADKGQRTPWEWLYDSEPEQYKRILLQARDLPSNKQRKFLQTEIQTDEFVNRQLNDTAYISRCVAQYLQCLGAKILTPRGSMTAQLRRLWGLNTILDFNGRAEKNRADHRHHAVDAAVLAMIDHQRLHKLANKGEDIPEPWDDFRSDIENSVLNINVSCRVRRKISGSFHKATFYGATQKYSKNIADYDQRPWAKNWTEHHNTYVLRKLLTDLSDTKQLSKVRDVTIRNILSDHLRRLGIDPDKPNKIPKTAFKGDNIPRMPSGVPINRARMLEASETFRPVSGRRHYQYVNPNSNHHIVYRSTKQGKNEKWSAEVITTWDAALRARKGLPIVDKKEDDNHDFIMSLSIGEAFTFQDENNQTQLCVVRKIDQRIKRIYYKKHVDARTAGEMEKDNLYLSPVQMQKLNARKVTVDPLGRIRWAND